MKGAIAAYLAWAVLKFPRAAQAIIQVKEKVKSGKVILKMYMLKTDFRVLNKEYIRIKVITAVIAFTIADT